ncbi:hypothetical protein BDK61_2142 [Haloarcula quadrata]|uniref:Uncharacterized protein n=2 Tax=Haloarcula TaxID=2237 RepID=Q5V320_HALMA|nr:unknown [Haloarcula marismortui ATCC 43049]RKS82820.1 hypothetical protein BDK61_2142 [Haloarcula quadrata]
MDLWLALTESCLSVYYYLFEPQVAALLRNGPSLQSHDDVRCGT